LLNTAPGFARVSIRIERANSGALGGKGFMRPGLGQLIGRSLDGVTAAGSASVLTQV
jgi:hypothetical protein